MGSDIPWQACQHGRSEKCFSNAANLATVNRYPGISAPIFRVILRSPPSSVLFFRWVRKLVVAVTIMDVNSWLSSQTNVFSRSILCVGSSIASFLRQLASNTTHFRLSQTGLGPALLIMERK